LNLELNVQFANTTPRNGRSCVVTIFNLSKSFGLHTDHHPHMQKHVLRLSVALSLIRNTEKQLQMEVA